MSELRELKLKKSRDLFRELLENEDCYSEEVKKELDNGLKEVQAKLDEIEKEKNYARVWKNGSNPEGEVIYKTEFEDLLSEKSDYEVFVIDSGEFQRNSVGEVYIKGKPASKLACRKIGIKPDELDEPLLTGNLKYKILVNTLKKEKDSPIELFDYIENCWDEAEEAVRLREVRKKKENEEEYEGPHYDLQINKYRSGIAVLSGFLEIRLSINLITEGTGEYRLVPMYPRFCLVEFL